MSHCCWAKGSHAILRAAQLHRGIDPVIRHAAAQRVLHALADLGVGGMWILVEQRLGREDLPVLAEAARRHLLVDPRLLDRVQSVRSSTSPSSVVISTFCHLGHRVARRSGPPRP